MSIDELHKVMRQLSDTLEIASIGLWEWHLASDEVIFSKEALKIIGFDDTFRHVSLDVLTNRIVHENSREEFKNSLKNAKDEYSLANGTYQIARPSGTSCWVQLKSKMMLDDNHKPTKVFGILMDVTEEELQHLRLSTDLRFIEALLEIIPNPIFYKDAEGLYRYFNASFLEFMGMTHDDLYGKSVFDIAPEPLAMVYHKADMALMTSKGQQRYTAEVEYADGTKHTVDFSKATHVAKDGHILGLVGLMTDITDKIKEEQKMRLIDQIKEAFLTLNHNIIQYSDKRDFFENALLVLKALFGKSEQSTILEISDDNYARIIASYGYCLEEVKDFILKVEESFIYLDTGGKLDSAHIVNNITTYYSDLVQDVVKTESDSQVESSLVIPIVIGDEVKYFLSFDSDSNYIFDDNDVFAANYIRTQFQILYKVFNLYQNTLHLSRYDGLTGLMNRNYFDSELEKSIVTSRASGVRFHVVIFDLDGLKLINDTFGHSSGDRFLKLFSDRMCLSFSEPDYFGRIGGDEFAAVIYEINPDVIHDKLEKIRRDFIEANTEEEYHMSQVGFSYGIRFLDESIESLKQLMKEADHQMYLYKEQHRGTNTTQ